uniref:Uncharacterized protein n=2 Tax=Setaria italica TaxID=4555 RepID=K3YWR0_SETIT
MAGAAAVIARGGRGGYSIWSPISGPCPAAALSSPCWPIVRSLMEEKALASITSMERDRRRLWWTRPHHRVDEAAASPPLSMNASAFRDHVLPIKMEMDQQPPVAAQHVQVCHWGRTSDACCCVA